MFFFPITGIIISSIFLGAIILSLLLSATQSLLRAKGIYAKTEDKLIYAIGIIWAISSLLPTLLFSQFLIPHSSFLIYLACFLITLLFTFKSDFLKLYPLQWTLLWLIVAILLYDLGGLNDIFKTFLIGSLRFAELRFAPVPHSLFLIYWLGLLLLFLSLLALSWLTRKLPPSPLSRSWIMLPSLTGSFACLWITGQLQGILLLGSMIGANLLLLYLNKRNPTKQFNPGVTSTTLTSFTLIWITLMLPMEFQRWFFLTWLIPIILLSISARIFRLS